GPYSFLHSIQPTLLFGVGLGEELRRWGELGRMSRRARFVEGGVYGGRCL
ncbi:hypothetical protein CRG98_048601, partial [Punica granatum]